MEPYEHERWWAGGSFLLQARTTLEISWACFFCALRQVESLVLNCWCLSPSLMGCLQAVPASNLETLISFSLFNPSSLSGGNEGQADFALILLISVHQSWFLHKAARSCRLCCTTSLEETCTLASCLLTSVNTLCSLHCSNEKLNMKKVWQRKSNLWWVMPSECQSDCTELLPKSRISVRDTEEMSRGLVILLHWEFACRKIS